MSMFCYQCEQASRRTGCSSVSVCGKDEPTSNLQDLLVHVAEGIAAYAHRARKLGARDAELDRFVVEALFTTVTNVNFDAARVAELVRRGAALRDRARALYEEAAAKAGRKPEALGGPAAWQPAADDAALERQAAAIGILARRASRGDDLAGLEYLCLYGLKGMAAYMDHALVLGRGDEEVLAFFHEGLDFLTGEHDAAALTAMALRIGQVNLEVMAILDAAHTETYGHPVPTPVRVTPVPGRCILVSGHDLKDLDTLLEQTAGTGIQVYTHGEMLPAHGYPKLKKHPHLAGNYGTAWQNQRAEFAAFPGAILMTTNCIMKPEESYRGRIFTTGLVRFPGVTHVANGEFGPVIAAAQAQPGFTTAGPEKTILAGFGHHAVLGVAPQVIEAVTTGKIRHFFLVGGCDGAKPGRDYFTRFAESVPRDCVILTLACGKYRFNHLDFGTVAGLPRLLDVGQCNDAYSAIQIAVALARAFKTDVNGLPLSMVLSWYEQKAVVILLTLLHLGIRDIRLGPSLPAFITPAVLDVLVKNFNVMPITTPEQDLAAILG
jgi:hydroxylamine reductase